MRQPLAATRAQRSIRRPMSEIAATIEDAFSASRALAASLDRRIYVAGGLFTAIEFAAVARGGCARGPGFFLRRIGPVRAR